MPDPTFVSAKESDVAASGAYRRAATPQTITALAAGATSGSDFIAAPGAGFALILDYVDWIANSTNKTEFGFVDDGGTLLHHCMAGTTGANTADNFKALGIRVKANSYVRIKNLDASLALDIKASAGYRIVTDP